MFIATLLCFAPTPLVSVPTPSSHLAWGDLDGDGLEDLVLVGTDRPGLVLRNVGDGGFEDVTATFVAGALPPARGALFADVDGDRRPELLLVDGEGAFRHYRNVEGTSLEELVHTGELADLRGVETVRVLDYDRDGHVDFLLDGARAEIFRASGADVLGGGFERIELAAPSGASIAGSSRSMMGATPVDARASAENRFPVPGTGSGSDTSDTSTRGAGLDPAFAGVAPLASVSGTTITTGTLGTLPPSTELGTAINCQASIQDQATPSCVEASSVPMLGLLYPLSLDFNLDGAGRIGAGTVAPIARLHAKDSTEIAAVFGESTAPAGRGVYGTGNGAGASHGVRGDTITVSGAGVHGFAAAGSGASKGVEGVASSPDGRGVLGRTTSATGVASGVEGSSNSASGRGVFGEATSTTGPTIGVHGVVSSGAGRGVYGQALATGGTGTGVRGETSAAFGTGIFGIAGATSTSGRGVYGTASAASGATTGVGGEAVSPTGVGVSGLATSSTGSAIGVRGDTAADGGVGVFGFSTAPSGTTLGVRGTAASTGGRGVFGWASAMSGITVGVEGQSESPSGSGLRGYATSTTGTAKGVYAQTSADLGIALHGLALHATGSTEGVRGETVSTSGIGVSGNASAMTGLAIGARGETASASGYGVYGFASSSTGSNIGVRGRSQSSSGFGVSGVASATTGNTSGVYAESYSPNGTGAYGRALSTTGFTRGLRGDAVSPDGTGVHGYASALSGSPSGVKGEVASPDGMGLLGVATPTTGTAAGVHGESASTSGVGVRGFGTAPSGSTVGVYGHTVSPNGTGILGDAVGSTGNPRGVWGRAMTSGSGQRYGGHFFGGNGTGVNYGVYAVGSGYAGYFLGDLTTTGTLSKGAGTFQIDHPLDPANKYLYHSFVESPDMMNVYNGNVVLDGDGAAWVELPEYFETLNREFRYHLTCIGGFAPVYIDRKIAQNRFRIAGGDSDLEVSWQVTGVRQDKYAEANRVQVEVEKTGRERGLYLHPEVFGLGEELSIGRMHGGFEETDATAVRHLAEPRATKRVAANVHGPAGPQRQPVHAPVEPATSLRGPAERLPLPTLGPRPLGVETSARRAAVKRTAVAPEVSEDLTRGRGR